MHLTVSTEVVLHDVDGLTSFSVVSDLPIERIDAQLRATGWGYADAQHAWISAERVAQVGREASSAHEWSDGFHGMLAYAQAKGWWDAATESIRAHITAPS